MGRGTIARSRARRRSRHELRSEQQVTAPAQDEGEPREHEHRPGDAGAKQQQRDAQEDGEDREQCAERRRGGTTAVVDPQTR